MTAAVLYSRSLISKEDDPVCRLNLSAAFPENSDSLVIPPEELGGNFEEDISYLGCKDVTVEINGETVALEAAIRDGHLSFYQIWLLAQEDAENGFCTLTWECENGLTKFCFQYPQLDLWLTNDIYKTPDGKEHHIRDITVCKPGTEYATVFDDKETGKRIDLEDWGIHFTIEEVSPTGITLRYIQSSNQVIGQLFATHFEIYKRNPIAELSKPSGTENSMEDHPIISDAESQMTLFWEQKYGALSTGDYTIYLYLEDKYDNEDVSPLSNNFYDMQVYTIDFTLS